MKLSRKWLTEFVDLPLSEVGDRDFDEAMTISGSKVEVTEDLSATIRNVKVGRVLSMEKHPNSDHMYVCQLDVGEAEPVQIVTGAWNVHVGDLVPAALHKSLLPSGAKIEKGKLRGVASFGMLCSGTELGVNEDMYPGAGYNGLLLLPDDALPGADVKPILGLDDWIFDITFFKIKLKKIRNFSSFNI